MEKTATTVRLLEQYFAGTISENDRASLLTSADHNPTVKQLIRKMDTGDLLDADFAVFVATASDDSMNNRIWQRFQQKIKIEGHSAPKPARYTFRYWLFRAAIALFVMTAGIIVWRLLHQNQSAKPLATKILPGGNKATLVLGNGNTVDLSSGHSGIVVSNRLIYDNGDLIMDTPGAQESDTFSLMTPKGGTYNITLPDGTKVQLNALSKLTYPAQFADKERVVQLEGEAYFAVQKTGKVIPFKVKTKYQTIEVLGTQFNVSAYVDEDEVKTTLVEGKVQVLLNDSQTVVQLHPGQQSRTRGTVINVHQVDMLAATAWKDGYISFDKETLEQIMQRIARWYDVDIIYQDGVDKMERFGGAVSRYQEVSAVLRRLELTGKVRFKVEERRIVVMP